MIGLRFVTASLLALAACATHSPAAAGSKAYDLDILLTDPHPFAAQSTQPNPTHLLAQSHRAAPASQPAFFAKKSANARAKKAGPWYFTVFAGALSVEDTSDIFSGNLHLTDGRVVGGSVGRHLFQLSEDFSIGAEALLSRHFGGQDMWEVNAVAYLRFDGFPWNRHLRTSFSFGVGPSIASKVPPLERRRHGDDASAQILNTLFGEIAFGLPDDPNSDILIRYHHRSGVFGLFDGVTEASTTVGIGFKRRF